LQGFKEEDKPNFTGSYYSHCKAICENLLAPFDNVLTLRVRMPIVADLLYHRNFITKIIKYNKVVNIPNSMTVLPELIPIGIESAKKKLTGIMNYTNPGAISHNEILELYKEHIDPDFTWENFTIEEQARLLSLLSDVTARSRIPCGRQCNKHAPSHTPLHLLQHPGFRLCTRMVGIMCHVAVAPDAPETG
jgi:hypothetical protein